MKYSVETIVRFVIGLVFSLLFVLGTAFNPVAPLWADAVIRFCGAAMMFLLGFCAGFDKGKDGAEQ